jgi:D-amino-acid dehydrogenase
MAAGSGRLIADLMANRTPEIDPTGLDIGRYGSTGDGRGAARQPIPA